MSVLCITAPENYFNGKFYRDVNDGCYWVSFLDGTQRVLLFTNDTGIATEAHSASRLDKVCVSGNIWPN